MNKNKKLINDLARIDTINIKIQEIKDNKKQLQEQISNLDKHISELDVEKSQLISETILDDNITLETEDGNTIEIVKKKKFKLPVERIKSDFPGIYKKYIKVVKSNRFDKKAFQEDDEILYNRIADITYDLEVYVNENEDKK